MYRTRLDYTNRSPGALLIPDHLGKWKDLLLIFSGPMDSIVAIDLLLYSFEHIMWLIRRGYICTLGLHPICKERSDVVGKINIEHSNVYTSIPDDKRNSCE